MEKTAEQEESWNHEFCLWGLRGHCLMHLILLWVEMISKNLLGKKNKELNMELFINAVRTKCW